MKKLIFLFILLLPFSLLHAQLYKSMFSRNTTKWTVLSSSSFGGSWETEYLFVKDTTINSDTCHIVSSGNARFIFKEDLATGQVWRMGASPYCDMRLFMDYALQKGDTFKTGFTSQNAASHIVDSVFITNGRKHIRFKYIDGYTGEHLEWIEGIGSNLLGINDFDGCVTSYSDDYLLCVYNGSSQVFLNKFYNGNCHPLGIKKISYEIFQVYPNPADRDIVVRFKNTSSLDSRIVIINNLGQLVLSDILQPGSIAKTIDISQLPSGIYMLMLTNAAGITTRPFQKL